MASPLNKHQDTMSTRPFKHGLHDLKVPLKLIPDSREKVEKSTHKKRHETSTVAAARYRSARTSWSLMRSKLRPNSRDFACLLRLGAFKTELSSPNSTRSIASNKQPTLQRHRSAPRTTTAGTGARLLVSRASDPHKLAAQDPKA